MTDRKFNIIVFSLLILFTLPVLSVEAQDSLRIGDSFSHLAYKVFNKHIETRDHYYSTADVGLVKWNKDFSYTQLSKVDGLSDIEPMLLEYDETTDAVIIAYANSNLDILYPDQTLNVRDILVNQKITGRRDINKLLSENGTLYIIGDFGVSIYDLKNAEFVLTLFTEAPTIDFNYTEKHFIISTRDGYYMYNREKNLQFFVSLTQWDPLDHRNGLPQDLNPGKIGVNNHCIVIQDERDLYISRDEEIDFEHLRTLEEHAVLPFMKNHHGVLQIGVRVSAPKTYVADNYVLKIDESCSIIDSINSPCFNFMTDYLETSTGDVLLGDDWLRFHYIDSDGACNVLDLPGPEGVQAFGLTFRNDTLYVANGGVDKLRYIGQKRNNGFSYFDGENWYGYSLLSNESLKSRDFKDIMQVLPSPDGKKLYLNSAWDGLAVFDFKKFTFYNHTNSCLETIGDNTVRLPSMTMDDDGNLWMANYFAEHGLQYWGADGSCEAINIPVGSMLGEMALDHNGVLWACIIGNDGELLSYDTETGKSRVINSANSVLTGNPRSIAVDNTGLVWVGATNGVYVFHNPFEGEGQRPVVDLNKDGIGDYLLMDQLVTTIGIDAANRKWFGTMNGVIVQSPNGLENELRLTVDNSPLPSNVILDFAFDNQRGIVYIGTDKGILGLKIEAIEGTARHKSNIYSYPNPVRPDYDGPIVIKGLAKDAHVRIVDQEGMEVKILEAYGGQAIWDGTNLNNERVASGVYVVFSSAYNVNLKPDAATTKILIIR